VACSRSSRHTEQAAALRFTRDNALLREMLCVCEMPEQNLLALPLVQFGKKRKQM